MCESSVRSAPRSHTLVHMRSNSARMNSGAWYRSAGIRFVEAVGGVVMAAPRWYREWQAYRTPRAMLLRLHAARRNEGYSSGGLLQGGALCAVQNRSRIHRTLQADSFRRTCGGRVSAAPARRAEGREGPHGTARRG